MYDTEMQSLPLAASPCVCWVLASMCFCVWVCFNAVMLWQSGSLMPSREVALELKMLLLSLKDNNYNFDDQNCGT